MLFTLIAFLFLLPGILILNALWVQVSAPHQALFVQLILNVNFCY